MAKTPKTNPALRHQSPLNEKVNPRSHQINQVIKGTFPDRPDPSHRKCFQIIGIMGREFDEMVAQMEDQQAQHLQELEQIRSQEAETASKLHDMTITTRNAQAEVARLEKEVGQLQQQLGTADGVIQGQVLWHDIQSFLHRARCEMMSMTSRFGNGVDEFENKATGFYLPGSGVIHGSWADPGHIALPELPSSGDLPFPSNLP